MADKLTRVWLTLLGLVGLFVGTWATFFPRSFYEDFPGGGGHAWVAADGAYNEHLVRDVGALNLALAAVAIAALVVGGARLVRAAALGWLVYSLPHLVFHLRHLHMLDNDVDKLLNVIALTGAVVVPTALLVVSARNAARPSAEIDPGPPRNPRDEAPGGREAGLSLRSSPLPHLPRRLLPDPPRCPTACRRGPARSPTAWPT